MKMALTSMVAVSLVLAAPALGTPSMSKNLPVAQDRLQVEQDGQKYLMGHITNTHMSKICDCTMRVTFFDSTNRQLAHRTARMGHMKPGAQWDFRIGPFNPRVTNYEINSIRGCWYR